MVAWWRRWLRSYRHFRAVGHRVQDAAYYAVVAPLPGVGE
jgi:hypothetical protein